LIVRWPGHIKAGAVSNEIVQHHDWLPTFLAMAGETEIVEKVKKGYKAIGRTYKNHIDGVNLLPYLTGKEEKCPRNLFVYISDDGDILAVRYDNWKMVFMEQRCKGTMQVWGEPFTRLRMPKLYNLRTDPYEFADITSNSYYDWFIHRAYMIYAAQTVASKFAETFKDFPPIQHPGSFTIDDAIKMMSEATTAGAS
jgi:arylsulfatase